MTPEAICYTGAGVDRAEELRRDPKRIADEFERDETLLILSRGGEFLVRDAEHQPTGSRVLHSRRSTRDWIVNGDSRLFLGILESRALFAVEVPPPETDSPPKMASNGAFTDLRRAGPSLSGRDAALLAYARGLANWHRYNGFCPRCGSRTASREGGHRRVCLGAACGAEHYPRSDPAVIMLVDRPPSRKAPAACLLGRRHGWPANAFSTLAGFVEPGESLEEAVAREVREESGIRVEACRYRGSQPWPFPGSLMLGFRARATTGDITLDPDELADARWFSRAELRAAGEWGEEGYALCLPRRDSIARYLIDAWLDEEA